MIRRPRRPRPAPKSNLNTWVSLGFLVLMLTMVLLLKNHITNSAAGCFARISTPPEEQQIVVPQAPEEALGNVRVVIPDVRATGPE